MSEFDSHADIPFQLKIEGEKITVKWQPGVPTQSTPGVANSAEGTISWNIPSPARGCATIADGTSAYCGAIVLVSNSPLGLAEQPVDGQIYDADPTVDSDVHAGDTIGNALVVGAFYEGEKKANELEMTTSFVVSGVDANTPYYIAVHAADCQFRYHHDGSAAYSREYAQDGTADTPSRQVIELGSGVSSTDSLPGRNFCIPGSPSVNSTYKFELLITDSYPNVTKDQLYPVVIDGAENCTYRDLVFNIRKQLIEQTINRSVVSSSVDASNWSNPEPYIPSSIYTPTVISQPPNTGQYCIQGGVIKQFDGTKFVDVDNIIYETQDPSAINQGEYWFNPTTEKLYVESGSPVSGSPISGSPINWVEVDVIKYTEDPRTLTECDDYWFNGSLAYKWCATTWCEQPTVISSIDPSLPIEYDCVYYWMDTGSPTALYEYNKDTLSFDQTFAIEWNEDPNNLSAGTYWFDSTNNDLYVRDSSPDRWTLVSESSPTEVVVSDTQPTAPAMGLLWYELSAELLYRYNGSEFVLLDVLVWPEDPTSRDSCDKWLNTGISPNVFYIWDSVNSEWDQATYIESATSPLLPPTVEEDTLWYNPSNQTLSLWNGVIFKSVPYLDETTDPTQPSAGTVWYNPTELKYYVWTPASSPQWVEVNPIESVTDPSTLSDDVLWYDTDGETLYRRDSGMWRTVTVESNCSLPQKGALWYDETEGVLKEWNGTTWVPSFQVPVDVMLNEDGHLEFTTRATGSGAVVMVIVPDDIPFSSAIIHGYGCEAQYGQLQTNSFSYYGPDSCPISLEALQDCAARMDGATDDDFLFGPAALTSAKIKPQFHGFDGITDKPGYLEVGVGTDGTSDERKALSNFIREQLGYPVVDVELTKEQIDNSVRRALDVFRQKSSLGYKRGFYFLDVQPGIQNYTLTARNNGYNKIVNVMGAFRFTSAFLSSAHGAGVYGQVVLQHLYNMGTYDLTSYHLISQYVEQLEHLFATRLTFHFDEPTRTFTLYTSFVRSERILLDCSVERTEQEIIVDRWSKNWIERWSLSEAMYVLARIRGKYASLPGAGGGVSLDAADLMTRAAEEQSTLLEELDNYVAQDIEDYGMGTTFIIG